MRKFITVLLFSIFLTFPVFGQNTDADTTCVNSQILIQSKKEIKNQEEKIKKLRGLVNNLEKQRNRLERLRAIDSTLTGIKDQRIKTKEEIIDLKENRIEGLEDQLQASKRRKWLYVTGGAVGILISSIIVDKAH